MAIERAVVYEEPLQDGYVPIVSREFKHNNQTDFVPIQDDEQAGGAKELTMWDYAFNAIFKLMNTTADQYEPIITRNHYNSALRCAGYWKNFSNQTGGNTFSGRGRSGWGIDQPKIRDMCGDNAAGGGDEVWQLGNVVVANWTAGALATRHSRNNYGFITRNAGAYPGAADGGCYDATQDRWGFVYWAERHLLATGQLRGHFARLAGNHQTYFNQETQAAQTDTGHYELGVAYYADGMTPFQSGVAVPPIAVAAGAAIIDPEEVVPVGVVFETSTRARNVAALTRVLTL